MHHHGNRFCPSSSSKAGPEPILPSTRIETARVGESYGVPILVRIRAYVRKKKNQDELDPQCVRSFFLSRFNGYEK